MAVKILIKRTVPAEKEEKLLPLILKLRIRASMEPGYISGETLRMVDDPNTYMVISTWNSIEDWNKWFNSDERAELQSKIDAVTEMPTTYERYHYPEKQRIAVSETAAP